MASIFTYEPDPPRVASPWEEQVHTTSRPGPHGANRVSQGASNGNGHSDSVIRLQAEPQDGPVEYKLHLLLRPRRKFVSTSTSKRVPGLKQPKVLNRKSGRTTSDSLLDGLALSGPSTTPAASTQQTRQHRLEQLTTQLLWRLQQSSPHHSSSASNTILPSLPEALPELEAPHQPAKLLHGLEESQGALYEIGVADDGTLVGLAEDEMLESLNNLRAMAACLGCTVETLREEVVGECVWLEEGSLGRKDRPARRTGRLVVAEAFVKPNLQLGAQTTDSEIPHDGETVERSIQPLSTLDTTSTEQLRITLTGPTMSGKSTLLGTLTTSTMDNGRGKSRLSMLKHRHEISSGITSSVTQELLGYADSADGEVDVINYATENLASWIDVHVAAAGGRLVFISDSAGHPRYRRTAVRGLVGWAPHWTLLCVPADDTEDTAGQNGSTAASQSTLGSAVTEMDLSAAQMQLCLRLNLPLVIVITKLDLASRAGLKDTLSKVLDALKAAGRKPVLMPNSAGEGPEVDLQYIPSSALDNAYNAALPLLNDARTNVPIVLTSALHGTGINNLHALLHELPIPPPPLPKDTSPKILFHIEDIYSKISEVSGMIVSGYLRTGQVSVGDSLILGPFSTSEHFEDSEDSDERPTRRHSTQLPTSRSFPGALRNLHLAPHFHFPKEEWRRVKVTSVRNLRLPVHSLLASQVGTLAIVPDEGHALATPPVALTRLRKGMVLTMLQPTATRTFVAEFKREDLEAMAIGNHVVAYTASVRASARVVSARAPDSPNEPRQGSPSAITDDEIPGSSSLSLNSGSVERSEIADEQSRVAGAITASHLLVTFSFDTSKEFVAVRDQVLIMPGGGQSAYGGQERGQKGLPSLHGFVGIVRETYE